MRKSSNSDKPERDWHYYLTQEAFKIDFEKNKVLYVSFFIIGLILLLGIAYCNRHFGG